MPHRPRPSHSAARRLALALAVAAGALAPLVRPLSAQRTPRPGGAGTAGVRPAGAPRPEPAPDARQEARGAQRRSSGLPDSLRAVGVSGTVFDSVGNAPLAGAMVQWAGEADRTRTYTATADSLGRYRLPAVRVGRYLVGFFHPAVDALGVELPPVLVDLRADSAATVDLSTPAGSLLLPALCGDNAPQQRPGVNADLAELLRPSRGAGAVLGTVRDADTGQPLGGARIVITWTELQAQSGTVRNVHRRVPVRARPDGGFVACGLPAGVDLVASADAPRRQSGLVELRLSARELARRDFTLGDSATAVVVTLPDTAAARENRLAVPVTVARGSARVSGTVRTADGRPLGGARVSVAGTDVAGTASPNGAFALAGLPAGTYSLEVKAIGYAPTRVAVNLARARPATVAVTVADRLNTLETVVVQADQTRLQKDYTGFLERQKRGMGRYITEEDIAKRSPIQITDVLRTTPGLRVVPNGGFGSTVQGRGNCTPDLYIDGMRILDGTTEIDQLVRPTDVGGIEVYNGGSTVPVQFASAGGGSCGVIAVWTKRGGSRR
jgi:hypothetical protein